MKKIIALLLVCVSLFSLCSNLAFADKKNFDFIKDYSLEELQELQKVVEDEIKAKSPKEGNWQIMYYVDEFKKPTKDGFICEVVDFNGTYSDFVTTNSKLKGYFLIDDHSAAVKLFEDGLVPVKNSLSSSENYSVSILDSSGNKHSFTGHIRSKSDRIVFSDYSSLIDILKKGGEISFSIKRDSYIDSYLFTEDFTGFAEKYEELFGK